MKKRVKISIIIASIIVIVGFTMFSFVAFLGFGPTRATADDFSLTIYVREENRTVVRGERIYIDVTLTNNTWRAQRISYSGPLFSPRIHGITIGYEWTSGPGVRMRVSNSIQQKIYMRIPNTAEVGYYDLSVISLFSLNRSGVYVGDYIQSNIIEINII
ncbi:MAG: hypothetical protein FWE45_03290 [Firmicutes bacterium]|nr:hypothetical protein [Bacillota bacterium]